MPYWWTLQAYICNENTLRKYKSSLRSSNEGNQDKCWCETKQVKQLPWELKRQK